jgi:hypothetical protein
MGVPYLLVSLCLGAQAGVQTQQSPQQPNNVALYAALNEANVQPIQVRALTASLVHMKPSYRNVLLPADLSDVPALTSC